MDKTDKKQRDSETVLMALDQISQTIEVMTSVVGRLRNFVEREASNTQTQPDLFAEMRTDRILH